MSEHQSPENMRIEDDTNQINESYEDDGSECNISSGDLDQIAVISKSNFLI